MAGLKTGRTNKKGAGRPRVKRTKKEQKEYKQRKYTYKIRENGNVETKDLRTIKKRVKVFHIYGYEFKLIENATYDLFLKIVLVRKNKKCIKGKGKNSINYYLGRTDLDDLIDIMTPKNIFKMIIFVKKAYGVDIQ